MMKLVRQLTAAAWLAFSMVGPGLAQDRTITDDFDTQMGGGNQATALGTDAFGESTDVNSGATTFLVTDVSIPGNNELPVAVQRSLKAYDDGLDNSIYGLPSSFWSWTRYEVPYLSGIYKHNDGWMATVTHIPTSNRCSVTSGPPEVSQSSGKEGSFEANEYWHGTSLTLPGGAQQLLAANSSTDPNKPTDGSAYYWVTNNWWYFSCLPATTNGEPGEGFLAHAPDGKKYYFDRLVKWRPLTAIRKENFLGTTVLSRDEYRLLLTRVEDRHGNWVTYSYSGNDLVGIAANDGRQLTLTYTSAGGQLASVTDGTRAWTYDYTAGMQVTHPDGTTWRASISGPGVQRHVPDSCNSTSMKYSGQTVLSIQLRSGATGAFTFGPLRRGVSFVPPGPPGNDCERPPKFFDNIAILSKVITGTGLTGMSWTYSYGPDNGCYTTECTGSSPTTRYVDVAGPGTFKRYTFGNKWKDNDSALLSEATGTSSTAILRTETLTPTKFSAPGVIISMAGDGYLSSIIRRTADRSIAQGGATYSTTNSNWDSYLNPQTVTEAGPNGGTRTTQLTYYNNQSKFVIGEWATRSSAGMSSSRTFGTNGSVSSLTENGVTKSYTYNPDGTIATITYPRSLQHSFSNYKRGVPRTILQPEGITITRTVSDAGFITSETDGELHTQTIGRDAAGRATSIDHPIGNDTTIVYSGATKSTKTITRGALTVTVTYDALWRPMQVVRGGIATNYEYDAFGRIAFTSNPGDSAGTRWEYDALGRATKITNADSSYRTFSYGAAASTLRDERLHDTTYTYRAYGAPEDTLLMSITAADPAASVSLTRDPNGVIRSVVQGSRTRTLNYDSHNYLTSDVQPEIGTTTYERDDAGNMTARTIGTLRTDYTYDGQNRLTQTTYSDGTPGVAQTWSKTHQLRTLTSSTAGRVFSYDANDNLKSDSLTVGSQALTAQFGYDGNDRLASITYPVSGNVINYAPDALGRATQVSGYASAVTYWPSGQLKQISYANGLVANYGQNARLWPSSMSARRDTYYYANSAYGYDGVGNLTSVVDSADSSLNRTLGYDNIDRLTTATASWGTGTIAYDGAGNITGQSLGSFSLAYTYDAQNRLSSVSGSRVAAFGYDVQGNVTSAGSVAYSYDAVPSLRCAYCGGGSQVAYAYDGRRQRVSVTKQGVTTYEFYAPDGSLLVDYTPSQAGKLTEHIWLAGQRIAQRLSDTNPPPAITPLATTMLLNENGAITLGVQIGGTAPAGTVSFKRAGVTLGTAYVISSQASTEVIGLTGGVHSITATYSGDVNNSGTAVTFSITVNDARPPTVTVPPGSPNGAYSIGWTAPSGVTITRYELYEATNSSFTGQSLIYSGTATSASVSGRVDGTYYYRVRGCVGSTCSQYRAGSNPTVVLLPPNTPTSISVPANSQTGAYTISWGTASGSVSTYELYEATNASFSGQVLVHNAATKSKALTGRGNGSYYYQVRACNASGCGGYRSGASPIAVTLPPTAPSSISVPAMSGEASHTISWGTATGVVTAYQLFEATNASFSGETQAYSGTATSVALSGRATGTYYYRVRACNVSACSSPIAGSNGIIVTKPPSAPASISVPLTNSTGTYIISWGTATGELTSYQLYEATNPGFSGAAQVYGALGTSVTLSNRTNGTYYYRARACNTSRTPNSCGAYVTGSNGTTVSLAVLVASVSPQNWNWYQVRGEVAEVDPPVAVTASGGTSGYTYLWEKVSGDTSTQVSSATSSSTGWTRGMSSATYGVDYISYWHCKVTSGSSTTYTQNVKVTFRKENR